MTLRAIVLVAGLVTCMIAGAGTARAIQTIESEQATFAWAPASGPVAGYAVYVSRNGVDYPPLPELLTPANVTQATVTGSYGDTLMLRVHAFTSSLALGPASPDSEPVRLALPGSTAPGSSTPGAPAPPIDDALLWQHGETGALETWLLAGGLVAGVERSGEVGSDWTALAWCDVDGNGEDDVVWETGANGGLAALLVQNHRPASVIPIATSLGADDVPIRAADFDGDGHCDLLVDAAGDPGGNLVRNGGFESGAAAGTVSRLASGSSALPEWTVGGAGVDLVEDLWNSAEGARSVELAAAQPGSLSQSFATTPGLEYEITFSLAGHPDGTERRKVVRVRAGNASVDFEFLTFRRTYRSMGWVQHSLRFVATSPTTTLTFSAIDPQGAYGPAIDQVEVHAVAPPTRRIEIWTLANGALRARLPLPEPGDAGWQVLGAVDVDYDGDADLLWQHPGDDLVAVWRFENAEVVGQGLLGAAPRNARLVDTGHLGTGAGVDLLWTDPDTGALLVWTLDPAGTHVAIAFELPATPNALALRDLDGDGDHDLLFREPTSGALVGSIIRGVGPMGVHLVRLQDESWSLVAPAP